MNPHILITALWILAIVNWLLQIIDLHTTAEVVKHGWGHEDTRLLVWLDDALLDWHKRFWALVSIKLACCIAVGFVLYVGLTVAELDVLALIIQALLIVFYWPIMTSNLRVYKER